MNKYLSPNPFSFTPRRFLLASFSLFSISASAAATPEFPLTIRERIEPAAQIQESIFQNNYDLRHRRKMAVGGSIGGPLGVVGLLTELNLQKDNAVVAGIGGGSGYNSFLLAWKRSLEGNYLSPYTQLGYSRWFSSSKSGEPAKSTILSQVLDNSQKENGKFGVDFIVGSLGLQYAQLQGETTGLSFFLQFDLMFAAENGLILPNGALGSVYFF